MDALSPLILMVDDDQDLRSLLDLNLKKAGYRTHQAGNLAQALRRVQSDRPDLILLEPKLPDGSGIELCQMIKSDATTREIPVVVLSQLISEADRVKGFESGAEDYICKPFSVRELLFRLQVIRRRNSTANGGAPASGDSHLLTAGPIEIDTQAFLVRLGKRVIPLALREFHLLRFLVEGAGRVRSREELLKHVWRYPPDSDSRTIETHIKRLRRKLGTAGEIIETVRSIGYRIRVE